MYETATQTCSINYWVMPTRLFEINPQNVINAVCEVFKITKLALVSKLRNRLLVAARNVCMRILRNDLKMHLNKIGELFNRHHTTVIHSLRHIENDLTVPAYRQEIVENIKAVMSLL